MSTDLDTAIIGAGPYGLSIAAHLRAKGNPYQIYGSPMESWRKFMPEGMILKSEPFASNLWDPDRRYTFQRYCQASRIPYERVGKPLSLALFLQYAEWFRRSIGEEPQDVRVTTIRRKASGGFHLSFASGEHATARRVVLATGHMAYAVMPRQLSGLSAPDVTHSSTMSEVAYYANRDVTIVGAGQSALETAAILHEAGAQVRLIVREGRIEWWNEPSRDRSIVERLRNPEAAVARGWQSLAIAELPRVFHLFSPQKRHPYVADTYGPGGSWWLRDRVDGRIPIHLGSTISAAAKVNDKVQLSVTSETGTSEVLTDHVIAATGFKVDIDRLGYLDPQLKREIVREDAGIPALSNIFETSVPGLYFVGITSAPVFGPIMRFMYGAKHAAPLVAKGLAFS
ncbi:MAG: NAD(P)-binding domain-containing protein [Steroidobacteraceae bacterium]